MIFKQVNFFNFFNQIFSLFTVYMFSILVMRILDNLYQSIGSKIGLLGEHSDRILLLKNISKQYSNTLQLKG